MTYGLTATGFVAATYEEIIAEINAAVLADVDPTLDLDPDQPLGQILAIVAQREATLWQLLATAYSAFDPKAAENFLLDNIAFITGTVREPQTFSTVTCTCNLSAGFSQGPGTMFCNVTGDPNTQFTNVAAVGPIATTGNYSIAFESTAYGPIAAFAGTLTAITVPITGWNSVTNPADAVLGHFEESDTSLEQRREEELSAAGACTVDSLRADLLQVAGVQQAFVFENETLVTDGTGLPGKAIQACIFDGLTPAASNTDVANAVWKGKPSGAATYGAIATTIQDSTGQNRTVNWTRAAIVPIYLIVNLEIDTSLFPSTGAAAVQQAIATWAQTNLNLGIGVVAKKVGAQAFTVPGVIDVTSLYLGFAPSPGGTANLPITGLQIANIQTTNIIVNTTPGSESSP